MIPRKTKILCTMGPASKGVDKIVKLIKCGMNSARLNFSHGTHEEHQLFIDEIREAAKITGHPVAILADLQGPKIRTELVENGGVELQDGQEFIITTKEMEYGNSNIVSTSYKELPSDLKPGNTLLLDDGYIILETLRVEGQDVYTKVVKGGILKDHKGIIAPGVSFSAPSLSDKDLDDLKFALSAGVDVVALSFVRSVRDIVELKTAMKIFGRVVGTVAKIERPEAVEHIDDIIREADSVMVARGDLGLEMHPEEVPVVQKEIIKRANYFGKPVITATQMLESMINNPRPTRAEASDVANAVIDGSDSVMLSGETSVGKYPCEAVDYMSRICKAAEDHFYLKDNRFTLTEPSPDVEDALAAASCRIAEQIDAAAIVTLTSSTLTAKNVAKFRPAIPIIGLTDDETIQRRMNFVWGVNAILIPDNTTFESSFEIISDYLLQLDYIEKKDKIVYVAGLSKDKVIGQNVIKVYEV